MTDEDGDVLSDVPETYDAEVSGLSQDDSVFSLDKEPSEDVGDETPDKSGDNETSEEDEDVDETEGEGPDEETDEVYSITGDNASEADAVSVLILDKPYSGFDFKGWYTKADCRDEDRFSFNTPITDNITLYAGWNEAVTSKYTVEFDLNGHGDSPIAHQSINEGDVCSKPTDPWASGYTFGGWYTDKLCTNPYNFASKVYSDITLYAKWISPTGFVAYFDVAHDTLKYNSGSGRYEHVYTGSNITPKIVVKDATGTKNLAEGVDYTLKYVNNLNVDRNGRAATATITGKGNYQGTKNLYFHVLAKSLGSGQDDSPAPGISLSPIVAAVNTNADPGIYYNGIRLTNNKDYKLTSPAGRTRFTTDDPAAICKINIAGTGNYLGMIKEVPVKVLSQAEKRAKTIKVTVAGANNLTYKGSPWKLTTEQLVVKDGNNQVVPAFNYKVSYSNNINAGMAKVTVTGLGEYTGSETRTFRIAPDRDRSTMSATPDSTVVKYTPAGARPKITVKATRDGVPKTRKIYLNALRDL